MKTLYDIQSYLEQPEMINITIFVAALYTLLSYVSHGNGCARPSLDPYILH